MIASRTLALLARTSPDLTGRAGRTVLGLLAALACTAPAPPPDATGARLVYSEPLGVQLRLHGWLVFRTADRAPLGLAKLLAHKQHIDDSPLFVAVRETAPTTSAFYGWTRDTSDLESFVRQSLAQARVHEVKPLGDAAAVEAYRADFTLESGPVELRGQALFFLHNGAAHQLTVSNLSQQRLFEELDAIAQNLALERAGTWESPFAALPKELTTPDLAGVPLHPPPLSKLDTIACAPGKHPLLFEARGSHGVAHLLGSIHLGRESFYPLAPEIEEAFARSERLAVEVDMRGGGPPGMQAALAEAAAAPGAPPSPEARARLAATARQFGLPPEMFEGMEPGLAAMVLSMLAMQSMGLDPSQGVDLYFLQRAGNRSVVSLEDWRDQLELILGNANEAFLLMTLDSLDHLESDVDALTRAWKCGDAVALQRLMVELPAERGFDIGDFLAALLDERNERMTTGILELLEAGGESFVVVGAAHLVGSGSIPALLREAGVEVNQR